MGIGAAIGAGVGAIAGAFGSHGGKQTTTTSTTSAPWTPQQSYILNGFQQAQNIYNQNQTTGPYTGGFYSPINSDQTNAINAATGWTGGAGAALAGQEANAASGLMGAASPYQSNAASIAANGIGGPNSSLMGVLSGYASNPNAASLSPALTGALSNAAINGANYLGTGQNNLLGIGQTALANPTQNTIANATSYANASPVQSQINATNAMIDQTLNDQTLPGINQNASLSGNLNSSRAGMETAMAQQGAANAKASADAGLFNNAYNAGLSTAASQGQNALTTAISANSAAQFPAAMSANGLGSLFNNQSQFNVGNQLSAANTGLNQNLAYAGQNASTQLAANNQLGSAATMGFTGATSAQNLNSGLYSLGSTAGGALQQNQNNILAGNLANWQMQTNFPYQNLQNYWSIVGKPMGTQTNGTTTQQMSQSPLQGALSGAFSGASIGSGIGGAGGLFGGASSFGSLPFSGYATPGAGSLVSSIPWLSGGTAPGTISGGF